MQRPEFDDTAARALVGAMTAVATPQDREMSQKQRDLIDGFAQILLDVQDPHDVAPVAEADLAAALAEPEQRDMAAQLLILTAMADPEPDSRCSAAVDSYCAALHEDPDSLRLLKDVTERHIRHSRHHLFRQVSMDALRTGSLAGDMELLHRMAKETRVDPDIAATYTRLESLPEDTLGNYFFHFYRNRGFPFPGEKGALPGELGFDVHDSTHLLAGYNTDTPNEINVMAFQAGATSRHPWLLLGVPLVDFNNGLAYDLTKAFHPREGNLDSKEFVRALDRGMRVRVDMQTDWDPHEAWEHPIDEVRERLGIEPSPDVRAPHGQSADPRDYGSETPDT